MILLVLLSYFLYPSNTDSIIVSSIMDLIRSTAKRINQMATLNTLTSDKTRLSIEMIRDVYIGCLTIEYGPEVTSLEFSNNAGNTLNRNFISIIAQTPNAREIQKMKFRIKESGKKGPVAKITIIQMICKVTREMCKGFFTCFNS